MLAAYDNASVRERIIAGQRRAMLTGVRQGRAPLSATKVERVRAVLESGCGVREAARR